MGHSSFNNIVGGIIALSIVTILAILIISDHGETDHLCYRGYYYDVERSTGVMHISRDDDGAYEHCVDPQQK